MWCRSPRGGCRSTPCRAPSTHRKRSHRSKPVRALQ
jgi:hypothetical protein